MNQDESNVGGWANSDLCAKLQENGDIYNKFSSDFTDDIMSVTKLYSTGNESTEIARAKFKFFLLSYSETVGDASDYSKYAPSQDSEGLQYDYYSSLDINGGGSNSCFERFDETRAGNSPAGFYVGTWMRSVKTDTNSQYMEISASGNPSYYEYPEKYLSVIAAFSMGIDESTSKTDDGGSATIKNPADKTWYKVTVNASSDSSIGLAVSGAGVSFEDTGELTVTSPNTNLDASDFIVTVATADSSQTPKGCISLTINKSTGTSIDSGLTANASDTDTKLETGQFRAHNDVSWTTTEPSHCSCTASSTLTGTCANCSGSKVTKKYPATGHVKADGTSALVAYGSGGVAKECVECGHVLFGEYAQSDATGKTKDPIEWIKLPRNLETVEDGGSFQTLMSLHGLDAVQWNTDYSQGSNWGETCNMRSWLNSTEDHTTDGFLKRAFTAEQQTKIATTTVTTENYMMESTLCTTQDKVFLLSTRQICYEDMFPDYNSLICFPTAFAQSENTSSGNSCEADSKTKGTYWWLRSPGSIFPGQIQIVMEDGNPYQHRFNYSGITAARPVINLML